MNAAFVDAGKVAGLEIWRIENFEPVPYPKSNYGKFYTGDSYIVLNTMEDQKHGKLWWDVHFWLGAETSIDEAGAAAICTVQLDDQLGGAPLQHREVQDHESQLFLSYFKNGVRYQSGGVASGFEHVHVNDGGEKRLFQVKGKRHVRVRQVNLSVTSMNRGDCFILDAGDEILVYIGSQSKRLEKLKAIYAANDIRDQDHHGRAHIDIIDNFSSDFAKEHFFTTLGSGSAAEVRDESFDEEDAVFEVASEKAVVLYKVTDASGSLQIDQISTKPLRQEMLNTNDCFILDTGCGIYVWVGRDSTQQEKNNAMVKAQEFLHSKKHPTWMQVHRVVEDAEPAPFKQYFATWHDVGTMHEHLVRTALGYETDDSEFGSIDNVDAVVQKLKKSGGRAMRFMPDNGQHDIEEAIKYIGNGDEVTHDVVPFTVTMPLLGYAAYILTYQYHAKSGESGTIIYVWEGAKTNKAVKESSFKDAMEMAAQKNAILVRTTQSHEPRHFLKTFKGKLLTPYTDEPTGAQLFRIRGTDSKDVHASEVNPDASSLASGDAFALLLADQKKIYVWIGAGASDFEKQMANERFANYWSENNVEVINEGAEPPEFWASLHGEGEYDRSVSDLGAPLLQPRLFHCRLVLWRIKVEEVTHFRQSDLDVDDVMLLDAGDEIYMWVGTGATEQENAKILKMAKKYIQQEPTDRTIDTVSIVRVTMGHEPRVFTRMFPNWEKDFWKSVPSYDDIKQQVQQHNASLVG